MKRIECWDPELHVGADPFAGQVQLAMCVVTADGPQVFVMPLGEDEAEAVAEQLTRAARDMRAHKRGEIDLRLAVGTQGAKA
jgi:hypothetical protein